MKNLNNKMNTKKQRVCPVEHAGSLDNKIRKLFQNPEKILGEIPGAQY
jgi:hypothetical protein